MRCRTGSITSPLRNKEGMQRGFSLVELSIVLTVMAITMGTLLSVAGNKEQGDRMTVTTSNMERIERAMADYVYENGRLPCPDGGDDALNSANFGKVDTTTAPGNAKRTCTDTYWGTSGNIIAGTVPVRDLDLPEEYALDGWGRRIAYVVDNNFTTARSDWTGGVCTTNQCFEKQPTGGITIGIAANGTQVTTTAVYTLISFGTNGLGAYPTNGGARIATATAGDEDENAHNTAAFDVQFVQREGSSDFDDIVRYKEKWQIISDIGKIISFSNCKVAGNVVDNPNPATNYTCTGAASVATCEAFATEIQKVCAGMYN
jgi:prepilin-type N-terminal cleavage/methylation domain-containing protein